VCVVTVRDCALYTWNAHAARLIFGAGLIFGVVVTVVGGNRWSALSDDLVFGEYCWRLLVVLVSNGVDCSSEACESCACGRKWLHERVLHIMESREALVI